MSSPMLEKNFRRGCRGLCSNNLELSTWQIKLMWWIILLKASSCNLALSLMNSEAQNNLSLRLWKPQLSHFIQGGHNQQKNCYPNINIWSQFVHENQHIHLHQSFNPAPLYVSISKIMEVITVISCQKRESIIPHRPKRFIDRLRNNHHLTQRSLILISTQESPFCMGGLLRGSSEA